MWRVQTNINSQVTCIKLELQEMLFRVRVSYQSMQMNREIEDKGTSKQPRWHFHELFTVHMVYSAATGCFCLYYTWVHIYTTAPSLISHLGFEMMISVWSDWHIFIISLINAVYGQKNWATPCNHCFRFLAKCIYNPAPSHAICLCKHLWKNGSL